MKRLIVLRAIIILIVTVLAARLYQLQFATGESQRYGGDNISVITRRYLPISPRRGEILASDGQTLLAESVAIYSIAVLPGSLPPVDSPERAEVLGRVAQLAGITSTLTISPSVVRQSQHELHAELEQMGLDLPARDGTPELAIAPQHTMSILRLSQVYSDVLSLHNPVDERVRESNAYGYQTVTVQRDISQELMLMIYENSAYLPGVVVVEDYQRHYPQSAIVPSLSHMLGYIGRINACELVEQNPASSWLGGLVDVVGNAPRCGLVNKEPMLDVLGIARYQHDDRIGKDGLEASYEAELRGSLGIQTVGVDALERPVSAAQVMQNVVDGYNLVTTLDVSFQRRVEGILNRWIDESERRRVESSDHRSEYDPITNGVAVVMDVRSGNILAMVSLPSYDNNVWIDQDRADELQNLLSPADPEALEELTRRAPLTNRAIAGQYPPGSSLKPFVGAAALQAGVIQPDTELRDPGRILLEERNGSIFRLPNSVPRDNGEINVSEALMVSSNVFFASIGGGNDQATNLGEDAYITRGLQINGLADGLEWFGFGAPSEVSLPGEAVGRVPTPNWKSHTLREPWTTGDTYNTSIGQGYLEVTPLQLTNAMAAIANNGTVYRPHLVQAIIDNEGNLIRGMQPEVAARLPVEDAYLAVMRDGMRRSITEGINVAARNECSGLSIAGKTGTAEFGPVIETEEDRLTRQSHSWFAGFAPYENPEIAVVVLLEGTGDLDDGSSTLAVPAVTQIMQAYFQVEPPAEPPAECPALPQ
jgi:penicillin-binding protein 2